MPMIRRPAHHMPDPSMPFRMIRGGEKFKFGRRHYRKCRSRPGAIHISTKTHVLFSENTRVIPLEG